MKNDVKIILALKVFNERGEKASRVREKTRSCSRTTSSHSTDRDLAALATDFSPKGERFIGSGAKSGGHFFTAFHS